jgi:RNA 3'-terminal phosphate cyclase
MALAEGTSRLTCKELSLHAETIIELLRQFVPEIDIQVSQVGEGEGKHTLVIVKGLGLMPVE